MKSPAGFSEPRYVTKPAKPSLNDVVKKMKRLWQTSWFTNHGEFHKELEQKLQGYLKVPHLTLTNNGTTALLLACKALDLQGEVITTPFTFPATTHALAWNGLKPVFVDIDPLSLNLDPERIVPAITDRTTAILATHIYGNPCDVYEIEKIAKKYRLKVIYDAAQATGVEVNGRGIGSFGDISIFSFHATKLFHTGEGGALSTTSKSLKNKLDLLSNFGIAGEETVLMPGINGKMAEFQAILGLLNLEHIEEERAKRLKLKEKYTEGLQSIPGISILEPQDSRAVRPSLQYLVIRVGQKEFGISRDELHEALRRYNVFSRKYFSPLVSDYLFYRSFPSADPKLLPVAHQAAGEVLCLPFYGELALKDAQKIANIIRYLGPLSKKSRAGRQRVYA